MLGIIQRGPHDGIQNLIEMLADVFGKEAENQIAVLLKHDIFTTISPVSVSVAQMLTAGRKREGTPVAWFMRPG